MIITKSGCRFGTFHQEAFLPCIAARNPHGGNVRL
jgi:hypothetical protein